jgi:hypothetical protein
MKKKRGGQRRNWAEVARVGLWYREIKRRCDWSDYRLDNEFAWTDEGKAFRSTGDRPRTFEWIRKSARKPAGRDKRWRGMDALVLAVDQHDLFHGTKALYTANFWELLQEKTLTPSFVEEQINQLLEKNDLVRIDPGTVETLAKLILEYDRVQIFDRCLMLSLRAMDSLSGIELVWLLYLQTEPAHNWPYRAILESIADKQLDDFFRHYFPAPLHLNYYTDTVGILLRSRVDMSERMRHGYGYIETIGTWPILSQELLDTISDHRLFYGNVL